MATDSVPLGTSRHLSHSLAILGGAADCIYKHADRLESSPSREPSVSNRQLQTDRVIPPAHLTQVERVPFDPEKLIERFEAGDPVEERLA